MLKSTKQRVSELKGKLDIVEVQLDRGEFASAVVTVRSTFGDLAYILESVTAMTYSTPYKKHLKAYVKLGRMLGWTKKDTFAAFIGIPLKLYEALLLEEAPANEPAKTIPEGRAVRKREGRRRA